MDDVKHHAATTTRRSTTSLRLLRETLRELDDFQIEQVAGGAKQSNGNRSCGLCNTQTNCNTSLCNTRLCGTVLAC